MRLSTIVAKKGLVKISFPNRSAQERIKEQIGVTRSEYRVVLEESAMRNDGSTFTDFDVHRYLRQNGVKNIEGEWFDCSLKGHQAALIAESESDAPLVELTQLLSRKIEPSENRTIEPNYYL